MLVALPLLVLLAPVLAQYADAPVQATLVRRAPSSSATLTGTPTPTSTRPALASGTGTLPVAPLSNLATIGTATTSEATMALPSTYAAGATPPVKGAPPLPAITALSPAAYPALDIHAPVNSPEVALWISQINLAGAPKIPVNGINGCQNTSANAGAIANASTTGNCWWTCGGCTRATDITFCPTKNTWGLSYDDGPSPYTPRLLSFLAQNLIKTTFFIVGSRAISRPQMLQTEYMEGHQLSVHTWSHPPLTTLSNEQIVAELGWTKKIIKDVTGVTPNTMRPPYGDIDDRVRYIALQMGLTPIIWTAYQGNTFDTRDWQIGAGVVNATSVYMNFENYLALAVNSLPSGFVVLAHDLYQQSVELAVNYVLPAVINAGQLKLQPIITCLGLGLEQAYIETSNNVTVDTQVTSTLLGASGMGFVPGVSATSVTAAAAQASSLSSVAASLAGLAGVTTSGVAASGAAASSAASASAAAATTKAASGVRQAGVVGAMLALVAGAMVIA